jgi:murein DD-endopeptidase MepM/ murein hydrolase activator NlpD
MNDQGKFGAIRKYDIHTGVDIYMHEGSPVHSIEDGVVVSVVDFTGQEAGSPWWNDTKAVMIEDSCNGVILYGELSTDCVVGQKISKGDLVGKIVRVLKNDKGKPTSMLHLELYKAGTKEPVWWRLNEAKPDCLLDPTHLVEKFRSSIGFYFLDFEVTV